MLLGTPARVGSTVPTARLPTPPTALGRHKSLVAESVKVAPQPTHSQPTAVHSIEAMAGVIRRTGADAIRELLPGLCALVADTEFSTYKEPQWRFILGAGDITAFAVPKEDDPSSLLGCVLRVGLGGGAAGYGMMVVSKHARGRGLARLLLEAAMADGSPDGRRVLAICTPLGQPFYAKLGFEPVSTVSILDGSAAYIEKATPTEAERAVSAVVTPSSDEAAQDAFITLDREATGFDRSPCLRALLSGGASSATARDRSGSVVGVAAMRQDAPGAPLIVGPIVGRARTVFNHYPGARRRRTPTASADPKVPERRISSRPFLMLTV